MVSTGEAVGHSRQTQRVRLPLSTCGHTAPADRITSMHALVPAAGRCAAPCAACAARPPDAASRLITDALRPVPLEQPHRVQGKHDVHWQAVVCWVRFRWRSIWAGAPSRWRFKLLDVVVQSAHTVESIRILVMQSLHLTAKRTCASHDPGIWHVHIDQQSQPHFMQGESNGLRHGMAQHVFCCFEQQQPEDAHPQRVGLALEVGRDRGPLLENACMSSTSTLRSVTCPAPVAVALHPQPVRCGRSAWPCGAHAGTRQSSCHARTKSARVARVVPHTHRRSRLWSMRPPARPGRSAGRGARLQFQNRHGLSCSVTELRQ